jgi:hypothetical protein
MDEFDDTFDQILAGFDSPAVNEAATTAAAPEDSDSPTEEVSTEDVATESTDEQVDAQPEVMAETPQPQVQEIDWSRPEFRPLIEKAQKMEALERSLAEAKRVRDSQVLQETLTDLADGDPERHQKVTGLLAQVAEPLRRQAQQHEQVATQTAQTATALHIAMRAVLSAEQQQQVIAEAQHLLHYQDPGVMERMAFSKRDAAQAYAQERTSLTQRIAELERMVSSSQSVSDRVASGADLVDGGGGSAPLDLRSRLDQAETLDDVFAVMGIA